MKRIAYWAGVALVAIAMFMLVQWGTCWWVWQAHHQRNAKYQTPTECTVTTTLERFGYASK